MLLAELEQIERGMQVGHERVRLCLYSHDVEDDYGDGAGNGLPDLDWYDRVLKVKAKEMHGYWKSHPAGYDK